MAISRHDPEWKRVVFMALAGGVTFKQIRMLSLHTGKAAPSVWEAVVPGHVRGTIRKASKYEAAKCAVLMMAETEFLPDAAKAAAPANGADELRSSI